MFHDGHIDNGLVDIIETSGEGIQSPHEHFGVYDLPAVYNHPMPEYQPPARPEWFDIPIAGTPDPMTLEPVIESVSEPEITGYEPQPPDPELFNIFMQQAIDQLHANPYEPLDIHDIAG